MELLAFVTALLIIVLYSAVRAPVLKNDVVTVSYPAGPGSAWQRRIKENKILDAGYKVDSEESIKEWDAGRLIFLIIPIFFPLVFFKIKKIKVTYVRVAK